MKTKEYVQKYTSGERFLFKHVLWEVGELIAEVLKFDWREAEMEFQDVLHFFQLWIYWRFGINTDIWKITQKSVNKFIARQEVWKNIYKFVGLKENISNFCGNYNRKEKVINHLSKLGIDADKAVEAYNKVVINK